MLKVINVIRKILSYVPLVQYFLDYLGKQEEQKK